MNYEKLVKAVRPEATVPDADDGSTVVKNDGAWIGFDWQDVFSRLTPAQQAEARVKVKHEDAVECHFSDGVQIRLGYTSVHPIGSGKTPDHAWLDADKNLKGEK